jgi:uncharacterized protein YndB with AHSA1/START domain
MRWQRRLTLLAMCIAQGMILLDVTIVNIALPSIQRELHASSGELEWVISAYALSLVTAVGILTFSTLTPSSPFIIAVIGYVLFGTGTGMWIPGVANAAMRDVPPGLSGTASGVFNASRQVGTSIGLAILGGIGADAATSAWTSQAANLPGAARRAAIGQARNVASARISSVTRALGTGHRPAAEQAFSHGYQVAVLIAGLGLIAAAIIAAFGLRDNRRRELDAAAGKLVPPGTPPSHTPLSSHDLMEGTIMSIIEDIQRRSAHIHWPQGIVPEQADLFAHNDIVIAAPPGKIWEHLIHATGWPDWYSNASDVTVNASSGLLGAGVTFDWITFGAHIHSTVHEFEPTARIGWYGETDQWLAYHTWLLEPRDEGTTYVVMEETGSGLNPKKLAGSNPGHMHRGHDLWNISLKFLCESTQD